MYNLQDISDRVPTNVNKSKFVEKVIGHQKIDLSWSYI